MEALFISCWLSYPLCWWLWPTALQELYVKPHLPNLTQGQLLNQPPLGSPAASKPIFLGFLLTSLHR